MLLLKTLCYLLAIPSKFIQYVLNFCLTKCPDFKNIYVNSVFNAIVLTVTTMAIPIIFLFFNKDITLIYLCILYVSHFFNEELKKF